MRTLLLILPLIGCRCGESPDTTQPADTAPPTDTGPDHTQPVSGPELCDDGVDNDLDGWVDGSDHDCALVGEVNLRAADLVIEGQPHAVLDADGDGQPELLMDERSEGGGYVAVALDGERMALELDFDLVLSFERDLDGDGVEDLQARDTQDAPWPTRIFAGPLTELDSDDPWLRFTAETRGCRSILRLPGAADDGEALLACAGAVSGDGRAYLFPEDIPLDSVLDDVSVAQLSQWGYDSAFGERLETDDLDGDGVAELGVFDPWYPDYPYDAEGRLYLVPGSVRGSFEPAEASSFLLEGSNGDEVDDFVLPGDLTGDGYGDLVVLVDKHALLLEGPLAGTLPCAKIRSVTHTAFEPQWISALHVAGDVNGDGTPDLAVDRGEHGPMVFFHASGGILTEPSLAIVEDTTPNREDFAAGFDVDGDGLGDLIFENGLAFYLFKGR